MANNETDNDELDSIIGFDALYESMLKCKKNVMWKDSVAYYYLHGIEETIKLSDKLRAGTYKARPPKHFKILSPKERDIVSITFRDRVYQRSLNDNVLYPKLTNSFIYDNMACQKFKGTDTARDRLYDFMRGYYINHGSNQGYVLRCDIRGYYPNMSHDVAEKTFRRRLPGFAYDRSKAILDHQYTDDVGYNPGSQMIQLAGISVLSGLDHYIKEELHIKYYIRYMDDFILIHEDKQYLEECRQKIAKFLESLHFEFSEKKTFICTLDQGIDFLGFTYKLTETGKVLMLIKSENVKAYRKKLYRMVQLSRGGVMSKEHVDSCYQAWKAHATHGNSYKLLQNMDQYYESLWKECEKS